MSIKITKAKAKKVQAQVYLSLQGKLLFSEEPSLADTLKLFKDKIVSGVEFLGNDSLISDLGKEPGLDYADTLRFAASKALVSARSRKWKAFEISIDSASEEELRALIEGLQYGLYQFNKYKSEKSNANPKISLVLGASLHKQFAALIPSWIQVMEAVALCRDLVNEPGGSLTPQIYSKKVQDLFKTNKSVKIKVRNKVQLEKENFNGLLTVGRGGINPPVMLTLSYEPAKAAKDTRLAFVGKGVTFDTGGLSLKPSNGMWEMRMDMGGSATAISAFKAIVDLKLPIRIVCVLCLTENRPGVDAVLPGDIFTAKNGKTIQVENTDAEGRLVLTDGLFEAGTMKATHIVDMATLTGAIIRAIGHSIAGVFSNDDVLTNQIINAGKSTSEKFWAMPMDMEYRESLTDKVADLKNIGGDAGAITAGLFLQEFVPEGTPWAHLDIAGTAFTTTNWKYHGWGATGWGVRSLVELAKEFTRK